MTSGIQVGGAVALGLALAGCSALTPRPDPSRFFYLVPLGAEEIAPSGTGAEAIAPSGTGAEAIAPSGPGAEAIAGSSDAAAAGGAQLAVGLAEMGFPAYLDRPELVTRIAANELRLSSTDRWAEPLKASFERVLAADLAARLGIRAVVRSPWYGTTRLDCVLVIEVDRFEPEVAQGARGAQGRAWLAARWTIKDGAGKKTLRSGKSLLDRPLAGGATPGRAGPGQASAAALSQVLGDFSRDLALAVRQTVRPPAG
ncbi:MAG TPA: PqiC family protein [Thermoanaerobaculia bacterium]|nr:PqiC family protein [Thermoanaerobaculia bacterium]